MNLKTEKAISLGINSAICYRRTGKGMASAGLKVLRAITCRVTVGAMIRSFGDRETEMIWSGRRSRRLPFDIQAAALRKLRLLNQARVLGDLKVPPGNRLEALKGNRAGQHSVRINDQWRICFVLTEGGPSDVEIVDYHD